MTVKQAAERLEVSVSTVYGLVAAGKLGCYRVGLGRGAIRIDETHITAFRSGAEPATISSPAPVIVRRVKLKHL